MNEELNKNIYSALPNLIDKLSEKYSLDKHNMYDIMLGICVSDEYVGTNHIELDIDKFLVRDDVVWESILSGLSAKTGINEPLPEIQKCRVVLDTLLIMFRSTGLDLSSPYNCEASAAVAKIYGVSANAVSDDSDLGDIEACYDELYALVSEDAQEGTQEEKPELRVDVSTVKTLEYIASVDTVLNRIMSVEFLNHIGNISIIHGILYRDTYGKLIFNNDFMIENKLSNKCVKFIQNNFRVVDAEVDINEIQSGVREYFIYWQSSLAYVISLIIKYYYSVYPVFTLMSMNRLSKNSIYPLGIAVAEKNTNTTRRVEFDNPLVLKAFNKMFNNNKFGQETAIGLLHLASGITGNKPISVTELRRMLYD